MKASGWSSPAEIPEPERSRFVKVKAPRNHLGGLLASCLPARYLFRWIQRLILLLKPPL